MKGLLPMIKLTNQQAAALSSPAVQALLNDPQRLFPTEDAFKLADLLQQIGPRVQAYQQKNSETAQKYGGRVDAENGNIQFEDNKKAEIAMKEIQKLASVELEYTGEKLKITSDWPKLTVAEAMLLGPIINNGKED